MKFWYVLRDLVPEVLYKRHSAFERREAGDHSASHSTGLPRRSGARISAGTTLGGAYCPVPLGRTTKLEAPVDRVPVTEFAFPPRGSSRGDECEAFLSLFPSGRRAEESVNILRRVSSKTYTSSTVRHTSSGMRSQHLRQRSDCVVGHDEYGHSGVRADRGSERQAPRSAARRPQASRPTQRDSRG